MVIHVPDVSRAADTGKQGEALYSRIVEELRNSEFIVVSFQGVDTATSSFVNASFVELLRSLSFSEIKRRIKIVNSTRQINDMIRRRLTHEAELTA